MLTGFELLSLGFLSHRTNVADRENMVVFLQCLQMTPSKYTPSDVSPEVVSVGSPILCQPVEAKRGCSHLLLLPAATKLLLK